MNGQAPNPGSPTKTDLTAVVVIPPEELWEPIQAIRRFHDPLVREVMPHVTLLHPFRPREEFGAASRDIIALGLERFHATLTTFRAFTGRGAEIIWLAPEPVEPWRRLQDALHELFQDCDDVRKYEDGFVPHLTVGESRVPGRKREFQSAWRPIVFEVRALSFIARRDREPFQVVLKVPLNKGNPA